MFPKFKSTLEKTERNINWNFLHMHCHCEWIDAFKWMLSCNNDCNWLKQLTSCVSLSYTAMTTHNQIRFLCCRKSWINHWHSDTFLNLQWLHNFFSFDTHTKVGSVCSRWTLAEALNRSRFTRRPFLQFKRWMFELSMRASVEGCWFPLDTSPEMQFFRN